MGKIGDKDKNKADIDVSIVIPARNEGETIGQCLDAVCQQETLYKVEIILIDSGSTAKRATWEQIGQRVFISCF